MNGNKPQQELTEINLTSLVDVALTLVIIFMVASPFVMQSGIKVSTPSLQKAKQVEKATDLKAEVYLKENGTIQLNGNPVGLATFPDSLRMLLAASASKRVLISAEEEVLHDQVIAIMDEARQCGAQNLAIVKRK
jgi:biopolymer transport protein ExbD